LVKYFIGKIAIDYANALKETAVDNEVDCEAPSEDIAVDCLETS
jgi:hypothetical protein